ncbi:ProQ/FINO family protein [Salinicola rhizosphaerae]|uniref:ProQ/FinO domain-containing protein n=1 Tax=Salinicola rhizosphaerae TaxID=1443141 RepID=A0ABQ3E6R3_9GAMM|nr:ProQ/FINO family protein [Salinicola rhizosphaerae]GHB24957.1 hypothetical protein GCM10009038_25060 [Salinicola rhizosphaerae]
MLTDRTQALLSAIEHQIEADRAGREAERERIKALEAENRALKDRLLALADDDPLVAKGHDHSEDPDGGSRARGLGKLAFRRSRPKAEDDEATRSGRAAISPLQRLTSGTVDRQPDDVGVAAESVGTDDVSDGDGAPLEGYAKGVSDEAPIEADDQGQSLLSFGAEHEAPSPHSLLSQWYKRYPQTFFKGHTRPLKTGIHLDLCAHEPWPEKLVRRALACYVHLPRYLKSVREGARRVDLEGDDSDVVSQEEAKHAKRQLEALQKKQKVRETQDRSAKLDRKIGELLAKHGQRPAD